MKSLTALILSAIVSLMLSGCNTLEGIGQDIKKAGGVIEDAAKKK
ncbi:MAG: entericidin A/B family lipoprotein [Ramlibacter sp.]|jgi:predicted small secreted protein|nr:entericidin A/B family lipoprotein [Ramlibacter sp.]MDH4374909.1 entericidin A/B family lipoprotein [Ramlibacter sp.]